MRNMRALRANWIEERRKSRKEVEARERVRGGGEGLEGMARWRGRWKVRENLMKVWVESKGRALGEKE